MNNLDAVAAAIMFLSAPWCRAPSPLPLPHPHSINQRRAAAALACPPPTSGERRTARSLISLTRCHPFTLTGTVRCPRGPAVISVTVWHGSHPPPRVSRQTRVPANHGGGLGGGGGRLLVRKAAETSKDAAAFGPGRCHATRFCTSYRGPRLRLRDE